MFRLGKKTQDVRLTENEIRELRNSMNRSERKAFDKRQGKAEEDRMWDGRNVYG